MLLKIFDFCMCLSLCGFLHVSAVTADPEKVLGYVRVGVTVGCELPDMSTRKRTQVLFKRPMCY